MEKPFWHSDWKYKGAVDIVNKIDNSVYDSFVQTMRAYNLRSDRSIIRKFALAAIIIHPMNKDKFLAVKRPSNAKSLPDVWGLPAITLGCEEKPEVAIIRLAREKLNTQIDVIGYLGLCSVDRGEYELTLMDIVAKLSDGEPSVWRAPTNNTKYVDQRWTNDLSLLQEAALKGSVCSRILLEAQGFIY